FAPFSRLLSLKRSQPVSLVVLIGNRAAVRRGNGSGRVPAELFEASAGVGSGAALFAFGEVAAGAGFVDAVAGLLACDAELAGELGEGMLEAADVELDVALGERCEF